MSEPVFAPSGDLEGDVASLALSVLKLTESVEQLLGIVRQLHDRVVTLEHANGYQTFAQPLPTAPDPSLNREIE